LGLTFDGWTNPLPDLPRCFKSLFYMLNEIGWNQMRLRYLSVMNVFPFALDESMSWYALSDWFTAVVSWEFAASDVIYIVLTFVLSIKGFVGGCFSTSSNGWKMKNRLWCLQILGGKGCL
jgi:hypothetical protein